MSVFCSFRYAKIGAITAIAVLFATGTLAQTRAAFGVGLDVDVRLFEGEWTRVDWDCTDVLWVTEPSLCSLPAQVSAAQLAEVASFVAEGGSLVLVGSQATCMTQAPESLANEILGAVGARARFAVDKVVTGRAAADREATSVVAKVAVARWQEDLGPLLLREPKSLSHENDGITVLLEVPGTEGRHAVVGTLESVGKGHVAAFGAPLLDLYANPPDFDNQPFVKALLGWLGDKARERRRESL